MWFLCRKQTSARMFQRVKCQQLGREPGQRKSTFLQNVGRKGSCYVLIVWAGSKQVFEVAQRLWCNGISQYGTQLLLTPNYTHRICLQPSVQTLIECLMASPTLHPLLLILSGSLRIRRRKKWICLRLLHSCLIRLIRILFVPLAGAPHIPLAGAQRPLLLIRQQGRCARYLTAASGFIDELVIRSPVPPKRSKTTLPRKQN